MSRLSSVKFGLQSNSSIMYLASRKLHIWPHKSYNSGSPVRYSVMTNTTHNTTRSGQVCFVCLRALPCNKQRLEAFCVPETNKRGKELTIITFFFKGRLTNQHDCNP